MSVDQFLLSADTTDLNYPEIRPTLDLNFARTKTLDPRIDFTRASGGSYVGADGLIKYAGVNEARFDHDPVTGESLGLLVEEQRQNLIKWSEQADNAAWTKVRCSITHNATTAPDGLLTADKLVEDTSNSTHRLYASDATITAGATVTFSTFFKPAERSQINLFVDEVGGASFSAYASASGISGSFSTGTGSYTSGSVIAFPNGWYRASITGSLGGAITSIRESIFPTINNNNGYQGDGTSGIFIWGAQLERGSFPTSYIPTQGSTKTRQPDNATMSGRNFSEWYNQSKGTLFANAISRGPSGVDGYNRVYDLTDGTSLNTISLLRLEASNVSFYETFGNNNVQPFFQNFATNNSIPILHAMTFKQNYFYRVVKESTGRKLIYNPSIRLTLPILNRLGIGCEFRGSTGRHLNGTISKLRYYPRELTPSQLQSLTE